MKHPLVWVKIFMVHLLYYDKFILIYLTVNQLVRPEIGERTINDDDLVKDLKNILLGQPDRRNI